MYTSTAARRWALEKARTPKEAVFMGDALTVICGRVCIPVCRAVGLKCRAAFKFSGTWYIPERAVRFIRDENGRAVYAAAVDMTRAKRLATV